LAEARILLDAARDRASAGEFHHTWFRIAANLGVLLQDSDRYVEGVELNEECEAKARQLGNSEILTQARLGSITPLLLLGRWQEALDREADVEELQASPLARVELIELAYIHCEQGDVREAERLVTAYGFGRDAEQPEVALMVLAPESRLHRAQARQAEALATAEQGLAQLSHLAPTNLFGKLSLIEAIEAGLELGDLPKADQLLASIERLQPGEMTPLLAGHVARFRARLAAAHDQHQQVDAHFRTAAATFREFQLAFYLAVTDLEFAEWLSSRDRAIDAQPLLDEARDTFQRL